MSTIKQNVGYSVSVHLRIEAQPNRRGYPVIVRRYAGRPNPGIITVKGVRVFPSDWDYSIDRVKTSHRKHKAFNDLIDAYEQEVIDISKMKILLGEKLLPTIKERKIRQTNTLCAFALKEYNGRANERYATERVRSFYTEARKLDSLTDPLFDEITGSFIADLKPWLEKKYKPSVVINTFQILSYIFDRAIERKILKENPFTSLDAPKIEAAELTEKEFLVTHERKMLITYMRSFDEREHEDKISNYCYIASVYALCSVFTGLRKSDWHKFSEDKWTYTVADTLFFMPRQQKNKSKVPLTVDGILAELFKRVREITNIPSMKTFDRYVQKVVKDAGIDKHFTPHCCRHSFGFLCAESEMSEAECATIMGVDEKTVKVYYHCAGKYVKEQNARLKKARMEAA